MHLSTSEENYLKCIAYLSGAENETVSTNSIAAQMKTTAASTTDMLRKLSDKKLLNYKKYMGVSLTREGVKCAHMLIRKHRMWEVFLLEKLGFKWDEVHEIAEQLDHIQSEELITRLEQFLNFPKYDPHGDPIPDRFGKMENKNEMLLAELQIGSIAHVSGVKDTSNKFLQHLSKLNIGLGSTIEIKDINEYDQSYEVLVNNKTLIHVSHQVSRNIYVSQ